MTKAYKKMSVGDAIYTAARRYPGSVEALAARIGRSAPVLRSKLQPDVDTHHLTLEDALQILELLDGAVPSAADLAFNAIAWRLGRVAIRHSGTNPDPLTLEVQCLNAHGAMGLLAADMAFTMATHQGEQEITAKEADTLNKDIALCLEALYTLKDTIEQRTISNG